MSGQKQFEESSLDAYERGVAAGKATNSDTELLDWLEAQSAGKNMKFKVNGDGSVYILHESQHYVGCASTLREAIRKAMERKKR